MATRGGFSHRRREDGLRVLDLQGEDDHLQSGFWRCGGLLSSGRHGGLLGGYLHQLGGSSGSLRHLWCQILHGHRRWDVAPFSLGTCHEEDKCINDYDYSFGGTISSAEYLPSTTLASGNVASAAGASGSA
jgi:hypothetical protein